MTCITVQYHYVQAPKVLEQGSKVIKTITEDTVGTRFTVYVVYIMTSRPRQGSMDKKCRYTFLSLH